MADAVVSRLGQTNLAGDERSLFLKVFAGEVLTAFAENNVYGARTRQRRITSGKTAQFPAIGKGGASYHTPGKELQGSQVAHAERTIAIDDLLLADRFIDVLDEAMNHYDVRSEYSRDVGRSLAASFDKNIAQVAILAARAGATVSGGNGGSVITDADALTNADSLVTSIFDAAQALDEKDVPKDGERFVFLKPDQFYLLIDQASRVINQDYNPGMANGSVAGGDLRTIGGIKVVETNNLPQSNVTTGPSAYQGDFSTVAASVIHRTAVGTVQLLGLTLEMAYDITRQGHWIVAKYAVGHGILRPESSVEIKTS